MIGEVTSDGIATILDDGEIGAQVSVDLLTDPPLYRLQGVKPKWLGALQESDLSRLPLPVETSKSVLLKILASPNVASREWIYRQYDHQVQTNTVVLPGGDAALLRLKGSRKGLAVATDGNGRYCFLDPYVGGMIAVAEACRNVSCTGATPVALTDCLNFGNPERPEVYYQLEKAIAGMAEASRRFDAPVISGNVSLYNESRGKGIYPTPVVGALGVTEDVTTHATVGFKDDGDLIVLLGRDSLVADPADLAGSEYLELVHGLVEGQPNIDLDLEVAVQRACRELISSGVVKSAHDCSDGGLAVAISECAIAGKVGARVTAVLGDRWDAALFGEGQSRIVVSLAPDRLNDVRRVCDTSDVPWTSIGTVSGDSVDLSGLLTVTVDDLTEAYTSGLPAALSGTGNY